MSSYFAEAPSPGGPPRVAGSNDFYEGYLKKRVKVGELLAQAADAKVDAYVADKTAAGPPVSGGRSFDFGAVAQGAAGLAKGLSGAFGSPAAGSTNPYTMDFGSFNPAQQYGLNLDTSSFWSGGGLGASGFDASAFSNPAIGNLDFGLGNNFSSTAFGS